MALVKRMQRRPLKLAHYVPFVFVRTGQGWQRQRSLAPGTLIELAGRRYTVGTHQEIRRAGPKGSQNRR